MDFYEELKKQAEAKGISLRELAKRADVSINTIYRWRDSPPANVIQWEKLKRTLNEL